MTQFDKLKTEISEMDIDTFAKHFLSARGMEDYICGAIKHPYSQCTSKQSHNCVDCIKAFLGSEVEEK